MEFNDCLALVPNSERENMELNGWQHFEVLDEIREPGFADLIDIKKEEMMVEQAVHCQFKETIDERTTVEKTIRRKSFPIWFRIKLNGCRSLVKTKNGLVKFI